MTTRVAVVLCALVAQTAMADDLAYSTDTGENLWLINFTDQTASLIGNTGEFFEGIALSAGGDLFGTTSTGLLFSIDTADASTTFIGDTGLGNIEALDFRGGDLIGVDFVSGSPPNVFDIDLTDATSSLIITADVTTGFVRSGALLDNDTLLIRGDVGSGTLFSLDLMSGTTTAIGPTGVGLFGLDFLGSTLYGVSSGGELYTVDIGTGGATLVGDVGGQFFLTLATIIPEPSSFCLLAAGLAAGGVLSRRGGAVRS